jgi:hypothetical protein
MDGRDAPDIGGPEGCQSTCAGRLRPGRQACGGNADDAQAMGAASVGVRVQAVWRIVRPAIACQ